MKAIRLVLILLALACVSIVSVQFLSSPQETMAQVCPPEPYIRVDARFRGNEVQVWFNNEDSVSHGPYNASVWAVRKSDQAVIMTDTFQVPSLISHTQYLKTYPANQFIVGQVDGYFRWNEGPTCHTFRALLARTWLRANRNYTTEDGGDSTAIQKSLDSDLGPGYGDPEE